MTVWHTCCHILGSPANIYRCAQVSSVCCGSGVHHKKTPKLEEISKKTSEILVSSIGINSGYTSRVMVGVLCSVCACFGGGKGRGGENHMVASVSGKPGRYFQQAITLFFFSIFSTAFYF